MSKEDFLNGAKFTVEGDFKTFNYSPSPAGGGLMFGNGVYIATVSRITEDSVSFFTFFFRKKVTHSLYFKDMKKV